MNKREKQLSAFSYLAKQQNNIDDNLRALRDLKLSLTVLLNSGYLSEDLQNRFANLFVIAKSIDKQAVNELMNKEKSFLNKYIDEINQE